METLNPTQDANAQANVNAQGANTQEQNQQQPVTVQSTAQGVKYVMPTAKKGETLVEALPITAKLINASARSLKDEDGKLTGESVVVLEFAGFPAPVIRSMAQVKGDMIEHYNRETLDAMSPVLATASYKKFFKGRLTNMVASYHEAGAIQIIDKFSKLYEKGLQPLGAQVPTEKEGIWIEGFLSVELTEAELDVIINRELQAIASAKATEAGFAI